MIYRAFLFPDNPVPGNPAPDVSPDFDVLQLLTAEQWAWFARVSLDYGKTVNALLREMRPLVEQEGDALTVRLVGTLPSCGLYGCLDSTGRTHT